MTWHTFINSKVILWKNILHLFRWIIKNSFLCFKEYLLQRQLFTIKQRQQRNNEEQIHLEHFFFLYHFPFRFFFRSKVLKMFSKKLKKVLMSVFWLYDYASVRLLINNAVRRLIKRRKTRVFSKGLVTNNNNILTLSDWLLRRLQLWILPALHFPLICMRRVNTWKVLV